MQILTKAIKIGALCALAAAVAGCKPSTEANPELAAGMSELRWSSTPGYVCKGGESTTVCVCDKNAPSTSDWTCDGMDKMCGLIKAPPKTCKENGWCNCGV